MTTPTRPPHPSVDCPICQEHITRRFRALLHDVIRLAVIHKIDAVQLLRRHMGAVHDRHEAGLPLNDGSDT